VSLELGIEIRDKSVLRLKSRVESQVYFMYIEVWDTFAIIRELSVAKLGSNN